MKRYDTISLIASAKDHWKRMVDSGRTLIYPYPDGPATAEVLERLKALPAQGSLDELQQALGDKAWRCWGGYSCSECGEASEVVVEMGDEPAIDSATVTLCAQCLAAGLTLARSSDRQVQE